MEKAQYLLENEEWDKAYVAFEEILVDTPNDPDALLGYAYAQYCLKQYKKAVYTLEIALRIEPENAYAHYMMGTAQYMLRNWSKAEEHHRQAVILAPNVSKYRLRLYADLIKLRESDLAIKQLEVAIQLDPYILGRKTKWILWRDRIFSGILPVYWLLSWYLFGTLWTVGGLYGLNKALDWLGERISVLATQRGQILARAPLMSIPFLVAFYHHLRKRHFSTVIWTIILWLFWVVIIWYIPYKAGIW